MLRGYTSFHMSSRKSKEIIVRMSPLNASTDRVDVEFLLQCILVIEREPYWPNHWWTCVCCSLITAVLLC